MPRRITKAAIAGLAVVALAGCTALVGGNHQANHTAHPSRPVATSPAPIHSEVTNPDATEEAAFAQRIGNSLLKLPQAEDGGWKYPSAIQDQHDQTDRDVGDASVGMGYLALADRFPHDPQYLQGAEKIATWLTAVENKDSSGRIWWNDYVDPGERSSNVYTSFDDGALGIGDFFWRLYEKTGNANYKETALGTVKWTMSKAENVGTASQPAYRWLLDTSSQGNSQGSDNPPVYNMGMGMGVVGIVNTLATYYERTGKTDPEFAAQCKQYIDGGVRYIQQVRTALGNNSGDSRALPETGKIGWNGDTVEGSGYLSGAAGAAYMYLNLYRILQNPEFLTQANNLLSWLHDTRVQVSDDAVTWHIAIDPQESGSADNAKYATGFEEGNAGIGWVFLQAYKVTGSQEYLTTAKQAANWLLMVAIKDGQGGYSWPEDEHPTSPYIRPNLDNGAAGISMFLYDLYVDTKESKYLDAANGGLKWLQQTAVQKDDLVLWRDNDEGKPFFGDTSHHWGIGGIGEAFAHISGGSADDPGEQDPLPASTH